MSNINDEMKATADFAVKAAKERFERELDYSENSLSQLESLIEQAYQRFNGLAKEDKTSNEAVYRTASIWGSYLGEFIRRKWGGTWMNKGSERLVLVNGIEFSPIAYIYQRITRQSQNSAERYIAETATRILPTSPVTAQPLPSAWPGVTYQPQVQYVPKVAMNTVTIDKRLIFAVLGAAGILLVGVFTVIVVVLLLNNRGGISNEFKTKFNVFLVEAEKINVMTEQGVSNPDFRNQLAEVKSAYSLLDISWPSSLADEKNLFDRAIAGWELTLEVWDYGLDIEPGYLNIVYLPENSALLKDVADYTGTETKYAMYDTVKDMIGTLMGLASSYFDEGKDSLNSKLN